MKPDSGRLLPFFFVVAGIAGAFGQASVIGPSTSILSANLAATNYTPNDGFSRLIVVAVTGEVGGGIGNPSVTYGGQAMTAITNQLQGNLRTTVFRLDESGIRLAAGYCGAIFAVSWTATAPTNYAFAATTLKDVDQASPVGGFLSNATASGTSISAVGLTGVGANDLIFFASGNNQNRTHNEGGIPTYTELSDQAIATTMAQATASKQVSASETVTATWNGAAAALTIVAISFNGLPAYATTAQTFYSLATGNWYDNTTWTDTENGVSAVQAGVWPRRIDNVIIKSGHTVTIPTLNANRACPVSATGLGITNVGQGSGGGVAFDNSSTTNFYHTGNITVRGTLQQTGGANNMMTSGTTTVVTSGSLTTASNYYNIGYLEVQPSATFSTTSNFIISGSSTTLINNAITIGNDFGIDWTSATLCGSGAATLTLGGGSAIVLTNGATMAQVCSAFTFSCTGGGCTGFPTSGTTVMIVGNSGPAGIGNSTYNRLWLKADDLTGANGSFITAWADASGNGNNAAANANPSLDNAIQPTLATNSLNGLNTVTFDGGDYLTLGTPAVLNLVGQTDPISFFVIYRANSGATGTFLSKATNNTPDARQYQFQIDGADNRFTTWIGHQYNQGAVSTATGAYNIGSVVLGTGATALTTFVNDVADLTTGNIGTTTTTADVLVGARRGTTATTNANFGFALTGSIAEIILYRAQFNAAQRIIMHNYLSAKYNIGIGAGNNIYLGDASGYDFDVAGIGQATGGTSHRDAKGPGQVRMWNPSAVADGDFLIWGHNNATFNSSTTSTGADGVDGTVIKERLNRVWFASESADVGTVNISFDLTGLPATFIGSNLRLMIDRDGNFATNDVTLVSGSYSSSVITFTGVNFNTGDRFTLGNTDNTNPLPIELYSFGARQVADVVKLDWTTLTEINNDFFSVERSIDGEQWEVVANVKAAGTSTKKLNYTANDEFPQNGLSYYRLKQTDYDESFSYSDVVRVQVEGAISLKVYPNPSAGLFAVAGPELQDASVELLDVLGRFVPVSVDRTSDAVTIDATRATPGIYFIQVATPNWRRTIRVVRE